MPDNDNIEVDNNTQISDKNGRWVAVKNRKKTANRYIIGVNSICLHCGNAFVSHWNTEKLCSDKCKSERHNIQHRIYDVKRYNTDKRIQQRRKWYLSDKRKLNRKKYYENERKQNIAWVSKNIDKVRLMWLKYSKRKRSTPAGRIACNMRSLISGAVRGKRYVKSELLIGRSYKQLKEYIQSKFLEGMSWDNYGQWHIDHIKPISLYNLNFIDEQKECFNYKNLQPLWAIDNLKKSNKYVG